MSPMMLAESGGLQTGLLLMMVGMTVVFGSLVVLLSVVQLVKALLSDKPEPVLAEKPSVAPTPVAVAAVDPPVEGLVDGALLAVLTAAATAALGTRARVRGVRLIARRDRAWSQQGRRSIMTSHRPQR
ncbi:OadG family transporter subunit [Mucisphaera sp.]|uniref:OadG family transporter subunit n=1 Tax=Mucisphaera sp. TaxID=2913024 RepID=UPI003D0E90A5